MVQIAPVAPNTNLDTLDCMSTTMSRTVMLLAGWGARLEPFPGLWGCKLRGRPVHMTPYETCSAQENRQ